MPDTSNPDPTQIEAPLEGDVRGVIEAEGEKPKKVKLFIGKKIWIAVLSFMAITIIASVVEYFVQTPISNYIEKYTGPRVRTVKKHFWAENHDFVFDAVKPKFHDDPDDSDYRDLYLGSTEALLNRYVREKDWKKGRAFLDDAIEGMPLPAEHRNKLRRMWVAAMPGRVQDASRSHAEEEMKALGPMWDDVKALLLKEPDDAEMQFEAGRTLAYYGSSADGLNRNSLPYFEAFLKTKPSEKGREPILQVVEQALKESPYDEQAVVARRILETVYLEEQLPKLKQSMQIAMFPPDKIKESSDVTRRRINSFLILEKAGKADEIDTFLFHLAGLLHAENFFGEEERALQDKAVAYFAALKDVDNLMERSGLPKVLPAGILTEGSGSHELAKSKPFLWGKLLVYMKPYCHERLFYESSYDLRNNCHDLLASAKELSVGEQKKWKALKREEAARQKEYSRQRVLERKK